MFSSTGSPRSLVISVSAAEKYEITSDLWRSLFLLGLLMDVGEVTNDEEFVSFVERVMKMRHVTTVDPTLRGLVISCCDILNHLENDSNPKALLNNFRVVMNQTYFAIVAYPVVRDIIIQMRTVDASWNSVCDPMVNILMNETCRGDITRDFLSGLIDRCGSGSASIFLPVVKLLFSGSEYIQYNCSTTNVTWDMLHSRIFEKTDMCMEEFRKKHPFMRKRSESDNANPNPYGNNNMQRRVSFIEQRREMPQEDNRTEATA